MNAARRRARPLLGTLVELGVLHDDEAAADAALAAGFAALEAVEAQLSRFRPGSDLARFHALPAGGAIEVGAHTATVLSAAAALQAETDGLFDVSLGSAPKGWRCDGRRLVKRDARTRLDLGGIGKGHAVDAAVAALRSLVPAGGWVNAGGDLRSYGAATLDVQLRDEHAGGTRPWVQLADGALATSHFGADSRSSLHGGRGTGHASVAAPLCLWADALTKVVAASGDPQHPALRRHQAQAWAH